MYGQFVGLNKLGNQWTKPAPNHWQVIASFDKINFFGIFSTHIYYAIRLNISYKGIEMTQLNFHNIFSPSQEIIDPDKFAGRIQNIKQSIKALCRDGASMIVYGDRGVGKTSFVEMVKLIAQGQVELIHRYKLKNFAPPNGFQYKVICIECDEDVDSTEKVLHRLITSPEGIRGLLGPQLEKIETTVKEQHTLNLFKTIISFGGSSEEKTTQSYDKELNVVELFNNLVLIINQSILRKNEGLLIVVDEFDKVLDNRVFSSIIKTLSKGKIKFLISGIAENYFQLLESHASIERQLFHGKIRISPMSRDEIQNVFELATKNSNQMLNFEKSFINEVADRSNGYPYYVQLFGQLALDFCVENYGIECSLNLNKSHLIGGLKNFALYQPELEKIYLIAIGATPEKELLLKALSVQLPIRIDQTNVFNYCITRGLSNPKNVLSSLLSLKNPEILHRIDKDKIEFRDPLFKIFANIRKPEFIVEKIDGYHIG